MKEINEKGLEKATGGLDFGRPFRDKSSQDTPVDPEGCCEYFTTRDRHGERKCRNCSWCVDNGVTGPMCINEYAKR